MTIEDDHNHFCIYCGASLDIGQKFCSQCGKKVYREEKIINTVPSKYDKILSDLEMEYNLKQRRAMELVEKLFTPDQMSYGKFTSSIRKSNQLFDSQLEVARKMVEVGCDNNGIVEKEIDEKIKILQTFIDKMEDLINELIIHLSSNKKDNDDINNLFDDMDDLIHSVKDY